MRLSNTATPIYYGRFREKVLAGEIPVCREIEMEMNRIDRLIEDPRYYYDEDAIKGYVKFCNKELTLRDGTDLYLLDSFKLWAEQLLSWFYFDEKSVFIHSSTGGHYETRRIKKRLVKKQFLIVGRGAAKTMYSSTMQNYYLSVDRSTTQQITTAPTMRQAEEVLAPIKTSIIRSRGPLFKFLTEGSIMNTSNRAQRAKLVSTKQGIENFLTGSVLRILPMDVDKLQGYQPKITTIDEWLSGDVREDVIGAIEQGASKNDDYIIIATSSEGTVRNGPGDEIKLELLDILKGNYNNPHVSIWYYRLDDVEEVGNPRMWIKANPNLDRTVSYEAYTLDVQKAENVPAARNDILAKRFGIPSEGYTYYFTYQETLPHKEQDFDGLPCSLGLDLSQGDDFCAFTFLFPLSRGAFGVKTLCFITSRTFDKLPAGLREKYRSFIDEGTLRVMPGSVLDMMQVYDEVSRFTERHRYDIFSLGFDPYNAKAYIDRWCRENGEYGVTKVPQGVKTESVPLGEIKDLAEDRVLIFDQRIMTYTMGNAIVLTDNNNMKKLFKKRADMKIDCVSALLDAYVAYKENIMLFE